MRIALLFVLVVAVAGIARAQPCECASWDDTPGVLWTGCAPLVLPQIAEVAAPALWFTRDEPLLLTRPHSVQSAVGCSRLSVRRRPSRCSGARVRRLDDIRLIFEIGAGAW